MFCKESDFEKIKACIDVLAQIIGFDSFEDMKGDKNITSQKQRILRKEKQQGSFSDKNNLIPKFSEDTTKLKKAAKFEMKRTV